LKNKIALEEHFATDLTIDQSKIYSLPAVWERLKANLLDTEQQRPGRLQIPDYLKLVFDQAKKNNKRIGLRIQMCAPDYTHEAALPDFVLEKVPKVDLIISDQESSASGKRFLENPHSRYQPRFDHPFFQQAFKELLGELAAGARVPSGEKMAKVAQRAMGHRPAGPGGSSQNPGPPRRQSHSC